MPKATRTVVYRGQIYLKGEDVKTEKGDELTPALGGEVRVRGRSRGAVAHQNLNRTIVERQHASYLADPRGESSVEPLSEEEVDNVQPEATVTAPQVEANQQQAEEQAEKDAKKKKD